MEYYFETDDKLGRKKYAEFLKSMLENCDKYRREDSDGAYVIAIDSPWGTGKTRFAKMLRNHLEGRKPQLVEGKVDQAVIPKPDISRKFNVVYYNSWESDYWIDAIEPLMEVILNCEVFAEYRKNKKNKESWAKLIRFAKGALRASGYALASKAFGETAIGVFKEGVSEMKKKPINPLQDYKVKSAQYKEFSRALEQVISQMGKPLVIIVDELDRCRPTFAIQTLELAKHLFAVPNLVFIFALDIEQLSCSIKTVYGLNMDAPGYLLRFIDYTTGLPPVNANRFISLIMVKRTYPILREEFDDTIIQQIGYKCTALLVLLFDNNRVSLRDITTLINSYNILLVVFLNKYQDYCAHVLYLFLLYLKYKHKALFDLITSEKQINENLEPYFLHNLGFGMTKDILDQISQLENKTILGSRVYDVYVSERLDRQHVKIADIELIDNEKSNIRLHCSGSTNAKDDFAVDYDNAMNFGKTLFSPDFNRWEEIRSISLSCYLRQQLEMFNFALPADNTESEV